MSTMLYSCFTCRWRGDSLPSDDWRCPQCGDTLGATAMASEEVSPWTLPSVVFSGWQREQGIAERIEKVIELPFHEKRLKHNGKLHALGRKIIKALKEYAELNGISTEPDDWFWESARFLGRHAFSVVLPMLPQIKFDGDSPDLDPASLEEWTRALRRLVNREATEELLGTDAHREVPPYTPKAVQAERVARAAHVVSLALEIEFARRSRLINEDDDRAIQALATQILNDAEINAREAAESLNWTESRFRKRTQRIREKLA